MHKIKWKVCGLRDNIAEVVALKPDYIGFIFYAKSPRYVGKNFVMPDLEYAGIQKVGVFVNETTDFVYDTILKYQLDFAQLHGNEPPEYCGELKRKNVKIIKAFQVDGAFDFEGLKAYEPVCDYFLFDTKTKQYGGSGRSFDWQVLNKYFMPAYPDPADRRRGREKICFLSGGIHLDSLDFLAKFDMPKMHAIDVNSKFEISPGLKNIALLEGLKDKIDGLNKY